MKGRVGGKKYILERTVAAAVRRGHSSVKATVLGEHILAG